MVNTSQTFVLVPAKEDLELLLDIHFSSVAEGSNEGAVIEQKFLVWCIAVDGGHLYATVLHLIDEILGEWDSVVWKSIIDHP